MSFWSGNLNKNISATVATSAIRDIDKAGSFDSYIIKAKDTNLSSNIIKIKKEIISK